MANFNISKIKFRWRGNWTAEIPYIKDDIVYYEGKSYVCLKSHTSSINFYYDKDAADINETLIITVADDTNDDGSKETFYINGIESPDIIFLKGRTYIINQDDSSNNNNLLLLSTIENGSLVGGNIYEVGVTYFLNNIEVTRTDYINGFNTANSRILNITVSENSPDNLYYFNRTKLNYGGKIDTSNNTLWELMFDGKVWKNNWTTSTLYSEGDIVKFHGYLYQCVDSHTSTNNAILGLPENINNWVLYATTYNWLSNWSTNTSYNLGDIVRYYGRTYICNTKHISASTIDLGLENNLSSWTIVTRSDNWKNNWLPDTKYVIDDVVKYGAIIYRCITNHLSGNSGLEQHINSWEIISSGIEYRNNWQPLTKYNLNDIVKYGSSLWKSNSYHLSSDTPRELRNDQSNWDIWIPGFEFEQRWSETVEYQQGDIVVYGGYTYLALTNNRNSIPSVNGLQQNTGDWELLTTNYRFLGNWVDGTEYQTGDVVRNNGYLYISLIDNQNVHPDSNILIWKTLIENEFFRDIWKINNVYELGDLVCYAGSLYKCIQRHNSTVTLTRPDINVNESSPVWSLLIQGSTNNVLVNVGDIKTYNTNNEFIPIGLFGEILKSTTTLPSWLTHEEINNVYYVSTTGTDDPEAGKSVISPFKTVRYACEHILEDVSNRTPATIYVKTGMYKEILPIVIPPNTAIVGDELRSTSIMPADSYEESNMFLMRNGSGLRNLTLKGLNGTLGAFNEFLTRRPTAGAYVSLDPGTGPNDTSTWITTRSPYVQNVTTFGTGCVGLKVDGSLHAGGNKSIVANDFTQILSDGIGFWADNVGRSELVSVFTYYCHIGYLCTNGGILRSTNGNNSYGTFGSVAEGFDLNEDALSATVNNRSQEAQFEDAFTFGTTEQRILAIGYSNAGQQYTNASITFGGSGNNAAGSFTEFRNKAISQIRSLGPEDSSIPGGLGYTFVSNNAQSGNLTTITLSQSDFGTPEDYIGQRIIIRSGLGVGQYGVITGFNELTKLATISKESNGSNGWDHYQPGWPIEPLLDETTLYVIEPRVTVQEPNFDVINITPPSGNDWKFIVNGNNTWVAFSDGSSENAKFSYSSNGVSWSTPTIITDKIADLIVSGNKFFALKSGTNIDSPVDNILVSTDGQSFTTQTLPVLDNWKKIISNGNTIFIIGENQILRSTNNGDSWSTITITGATTQVWELGAYGNNRFILIDVTSGDIAYTDDTGLSWNIVNNAIDSNNWSDITYGNGRFVAINDSVNTITTSVVSRSFDGINWYNAQIEIGNFHSLSYGSGVFIATGDTDVVAISYDSVTWRTFNDDSTSYNLTTSGTWMKSYHHNGSWIIVNSTGSWNRLQTGARPIIRAKVENSRITSFIIYDPGSNYSTIPNLTITDNRNSANVLYRVYINDGVLSQPEMQNRGTGYVTTTAEIAGNGFAEIYQLGKTLIVSNLTDLPGPGANIEISGINDQRYSLIKILSYTGTGPYEAVLQITPPLRANETPEHGIELEIRERYSQVRLTGHDFLDIGTGNFDQTRYPELYLEGETSENARQPFNEAVSFGGGRVFYTATDQNGNFKVGSLFSVEQDTGVVTIDASQFDLSGLTELSLGGISVGGRAVVVREFSKDPTFISDSNSIIPTQRAIKTYIESRFSGGGSNVNTNRLVSGQISISTNNITTTSDLQINVNSPVLIKKGIDGTYLALQYFKAT